MMESPVRRALAVAALFVMAAAVVSVPSADGDTVSDGFVFDASAGTVLGYSGEPAGVLEIPDRLDGVTVTAVGEGAFEGCTGITGLVLPDSVHRIGKDAFAGCSGISGGLDLPRYLQYLGDRAFEGCSGITGTLYVPDSLREIGSGTFRGCSGLSSLMHGHAPYLYSVGDSAFEDCSGLSGMLNLPSRLKYVGEHAFSGCTSLEGTLYLPDSLQTLGDGAFSDCRGLSGTVYIPQSLQDLGERTFSGCPLVTAFAVQRGNHSYVSSGGVVYDRDMEVLVAGPEGLTGTLDLPRGVTMVADNALRGSGLERITFPNGSGLTAIGDWAFADCADLSGELVLPGNLVTVGTGAFCGCVSLTGLTIDAELEVLGSLSFAGTGISGRMHIPAGVHGIMPGAFAGSGVTGFDVDTGNPYMGSDGDGMLLSADGRTLLMCGNLAEAAVPKGVHTIGEMAFAGSDLRTVWIPAGIRTVSGGAFAWCASLESFSLPPGVSLGPRAFHGCTGLKDAEFRGNPSHAAPDSFDTEFYDGTTFIDDTDRMYGDFHRDYPNGSPLVKVMNVTFVSEGTGTDVSVLYGDTVVKPANPVRDLYRFDGWLLDGKRYDFGSPVTSDLVLTASWTLIPEYVDGDGGAEYLPVLALAIAMFGSVLGMYYLTLRER